MPIKVIPIKGGKFDKAGAQDKMEKKKNAMKNMEDVSKNNLPKKKMGGGMMRPMKAAGGAAIGAIAAGAGAIGAAALRANKKIADKAKEKKNKMRQEEFRNRGKVKRKMGGGMMKQPMGYTSGGMCRGMGAAIRGGKFEGVK